MVMKRIIAGIVTFNPEVSRLKRNIEAVLSQVSKVVIVDNASNNIKEIKELCYIYGVDVLSNDKNYGIARALNQIMEYGKECADWVLTLDQDSVCPKDYCKKAEIYMEEESVGIICPRIYEKNIDRVLSKNNKKNQEYEYIKRCITSAALTRVEAYEKTQGFDETFFIDYVDFDYSLKLRNAGYKILRMQNVFLEHQLGESVLRKFLWKTVRVTSHSAEREYYIARNIIFYVKRYYKKENCFRDIMSLVKHFVFVLCYEEEKKSKFKALYIGVKDGLK